MNKLGLAVFSLAIAIAAAGVRADTYVIGADGIHDSVYFRSSAKLEFVEGATNKISGFVSVDPANTGGGIDGIWQVDLRTLKTGIDLRDEHMRERHLQTDKFPFAYFTMTKLATAPMSLAVDSMYTVTGEGKFYIHGVWRPVAVTADVSRHRIDDRSGSLSVRARFSLKLDDFGIPRPKALFLKLAETINVEVIFTAANNLPAPTITLPEWSEKK